LNYLDSIGFSAYILQDSEGFSLAESGVVEDSVYDVMENIANFMLSGDNDLNYLTWESSKGRFFSIAIDGGFLFVAKLTKKLPTTKVIFLKDRIAASCMALIE